MRILGMSRYKWRQSLEHVNLVQGFYGTTSHIHGYSWSMCTVLVVTRGRYKRAFEKVDDDNIWKDNKFTNHSANIFVLKEGGKVKLKPILLKSDYIPNLIYNLNIIYANLNIIYEV